MRSLRDVAGHFDTVRGAGTPLLTVDDVWASYDAQPILRGVSLEVSDGECVAIFGTNGAGKSTLFRTILGLNPVLSGELRFDGRAIAGIPPHVNARRGIALVPQGGGSLDGLTVLQNLALAAGPRSGLHDRLDELGELYPPLPGLLDRFGRELSGGERQFVAIARALLMRPRLVLFDEPTAGVAPRYVDAVFELLARLKTEAQMTSMFIEHNLTVGREVLDRYYVLERGRVAHHGDRAEFLGHPETWRPFLTGVRPSATEPLRRAPQGTWLGAAEDQPQAQRRAPT
jgi:branched-chain amino acid transport system ATP-binding protein